MKTVIWPSLIVGFALAGSCCAAAEVTLEEAPPVVVKTVPESGAAEIDPNLKEIKVTFSKNMTDRSWSPTSVSKESFPETPGQPKFLQDKRTFVLPVKLAAGKTYAVLLNSEKFKNFKDADGHPAIPYLLVFRTKGGANTKSAESDSTRDLWTEKTVGVAFDGFWNEMDRQYSYFALKKDVDWDALKEKYRPQAIKTANSQQLAGVLQQMLAPLRDVHIWIETPNGQLPTYRSGYTYNGNRTATLDMLEQTTKCGEFAIVGRTKPDGFGYFLMNRQSEANDSNVKQALDALEVLRDAPGFIVDLRVANGGSEPLALRIAQWFCANNTVYAKSKRRNGPDHDNFTVVTNRTLTASRRPYTKPTVCLIGPGAVSSGEAFVKMMKCLPQVTTVGLPTRGASGNPQPAKLAGTDIQVWFSRWVDMTADGETFEGQGIPPDVRIDQPSEAYLRGDPTLEKGLEILRQKVAAAPAASE